MRSQFLEIEFIPANARNQDMGELVRALGRQLIDVCNEENDARQAPAQAIIARVVTKEKVYE